MSKGGRGRDYPDFMYLAYEALISVYASARQVELAHKVVWKLMRRTVKKMFPDDEAMRLPSKPMRRHHYLYGRNRYLSNPAVLEGLAKLHRKLAARQARELGLMDPAGPGSWTHPHLSRRLYSDGKVITPLYKTRPGDERVDRKTARPSSRRSSLPRWPTSSGCTSWAPSTPLRRCPVVNRYCIFQVFHR